VARGDQRRHHNPRDQRGGDCGAGRQALREVAVLPEQLSRDAVDQDVERYDHGERNRGKQPEALAVEPERAAQDLADVARLRQVDWARNATPPEYASTCGRTAPVESSTAV
jgi:hypothetical protein